MPSNEFTDYPPTVTLDLSGVKPLIINNAEPSRTEFVVPIDKFLKNSLKLEPDIAEYSDINDINFGDYDGIILSASPRGDDIVEHHVSKYYGKQWKMMSEKPILGICAGHHIVGHIYGSDLIRGLQSEDGEDFYVRVDKNDKLFDGYGKIIRVVQHHNDSITLPPGFIKLAHSEKCDNQIMKHGEKPIYTVQFHGEHNYRILRNFILHNVYRQK
jgi:GMP synthase (glutamine-hydrolysing)